jgi:phospholipid/cholesterol/gamma-HCH transport system substrate-binding protein
VTVHNILGKSLGIGAFVAFTLMLFAVLFNGAGGRLRVSEPYSVQVVMPDAFQLVQNADVRWAGVKIGQVSNIQSRGAQAVVKIEIDKKYAPLYRDASTLLRTKTLVGENYLQVNPGTPRAGALAKNAAIPIEQAGEAVQLDEILSSLDTRTRSAISRNLDGLGTGVAGRSAELGRLFAATRPTLADGATVMSAVRTQREGFAQLVQDTGEVTQAVAGRSRDLQTLARSAKATAQAVAARDEALGQTIEQLPGTLRQARKSVAHLQAFARDATPVMADLETGFARLEPVVKALPRAASSSRVMVRQLEPFLKVADPLLSRLRPFTSALTPTMPALDALLHQVQPMATYLKPYYRDAAALFAANGAMLSYRDKFGGAARIFNTIDIDSYAGFSPEMREAVDRLQAIGALAVENFPRKGKNAYPAPGAIGTPAPFDGHYPRVVARP